MEKEIQLTRHQMPFHPLTWMRSKRMYFLFLAILVFIVYANALNNSFVSDDKGLFINVPIWNLQYFLDSPHAFLRPLIYLTAYKLSGFNPFLFHIPNIIFHTGVVFLIYLIISAMKKPKVAFLAAALFAVHPILAESVTWISAGGYVQYGFFFLLSLLFYILQPRTILKYTLSIVFYTLALISSEKAVVLVAIPFLYELSFGNVIKSWKRLLPYFILSVIWISFYLRLFAMRGGYFTGQQQIDPTIVNPIFQVPIAVTSYLQLIFWPNELTIYHTELSFTFFEFIIRSIIVIVFLGSIIYFFKRDRFIFFWLTFFWTSLLITLNPFVHAWIVAERYVYLGTAGILIVVAMLFEKLSQMPKLKSATYVIFFLIIVSLMIRTIARNIDWQDEDHLWVATARTSPSSAQNHNNLGDYYGRHGDIQNAIKEFQIAIALKPNYADAYHNLGNAYRDLGDNKAAVSSYEEALSIEPRIWQSYQNIAVIYYEQKEFDKAKEFIEKGVLVESQNPNLRLLQGLIYVKTNEREKAQELLLQILKLDPTNQLAKQGLNEIEQK